MEPGYYWNYEVKFDVWALIEIDKKGRGWYFGNKCPILEEDLLDKSNHWLVGPLILPEPNS